MDCGVCQLRSAVGYCAECKKLLCEVCQESCSHCGKIVCPTNAHSTRSGRRLCTTCMERYKRHQARKKARSKKEPARHA